MLCVCPCPPLQAFLEDPLGGKSGPPHPPQHRPNISLTLPQTTALEERIREELTLLGLLEPVEVGGALWKWVEYHGRGGAGSVKSLLSYTCKYLPFSPSLLLPPLEQPKR